MTRQEQGQLASGTRAAVEHFDVLIIGAGLSGIGAACHRRRRCPERSFLLLESRETLGGTWTLKADLTSAYVCRLLNHMRKTGARRVVARLEPGELTAEPLLDFTSGYVQRARDQFPKQGREKPWRVYQNYILDLLSLRFSSLTHTALEFR